MKENKLDIREAKEAFPGVYLVLEQAMSRLHATTIGKLKFASFGLFRSQSGLLVKDRSGLDEARDVVRLKPEILENLIQQPLEPPVFSPCLYSLRRDQMKDGLLFFTLF